MQRLALVALLSVVPAAQAWDYEGHRIVNQLALAALPPEFPAFVHQPENAERIAFLAGEPDRWRNNPDFPIKQFNVLDHYLDFEQLEWAGLDSKTVSDLRYVFVVDFAKGRAANTDKFPSINPARNKDHTREWPGFLPWAVTEYYGKLKSAFSYLKAYETFGGTPEEIANAQANIVYMMGVMGHYVGDGAQPLHTTVHHNGWEGENPHDYTKWRGIHAWIDGEFIGQTGINAESLRSRVTEVVPLNMSSRADGRDPVFVATMDYVAEQNAQVEPLYVLDKEHGFKLDDASEAAQGQAFIKKQLIRGGEMLAAIWLTAWRNTTEDKYLTDQLTKRTEAQFGN